MFGEIWMLVTLIAVGVFWLWLYVMVKRFGRGVDRLSEAVDKAHEHATAAMKALDTIYISENGDDKNPGTIGAPKKTFAGALESIEPVSDPYKLDK